MSQARELDINFWPAYVDALINVVLNLLFLAGVFTIGLVVLNTEAVKAEKQAAALQVKQILADELPNNRRKKAQALLKEISPEQSMAVPKAEAYLSGPMLTEIRISRVMAAPLITGADLQLDLSPELLKANALAQATTGGRIVLRVMFEPGKYSLPEGWSHNTTMVFAPNKKYVLLAMADPKNSRLAREAFARQMALRNALVSMGIADKQFELKMTDTKEDLQNSNDIERLVFVIELTQ